jgi:ABC-type antimicrobial peptide transport system permease subunit
VTSVRARRRDLAILKTLGFSRRQVSGTVAWQASTLVAFALTCGVPLGIGAGRWAWGAFAQGIAVVPAPVLNPIWVALGLPVAVLLANLIAALPARSAARTKPAIVLRSE